MKKADCLNLTFGTFAVANCFKFLYVSAIDDALK